jgi:Zn-dependent peptidase ImmA (M78 family)
VGKSIKARIKPDLLRWARESMRMELDVAAEKIRVPSDRLRAWEEGTEEFSVAQLRKAAEVYKRPLAVFFLPRPPKDFKAMRDFRRLPGVPDDPSPALMQELRLAAARRDIAEEMIEMLGETPPRFELRGRQSERPAKVAEPARTALGISLEEQARWKDDYDALNGWRSAVERLGVLVFQVSGVPVQESRGFSAHFDPFPVIALNTKDSPVARCFTLMHELGHLVLHGGAVCDAEVMGDVRFNPTEVWCNEFAAEVLVPTDDFEPRARSFPYDNEWPREALRQLANRYKVSQEVVYRRLLTLGRTTQDAYQKWRASYRPPAQPKKSKGGPEWPVRVVSNSGRTFVALALAAYTTNQITASTLSGHLGAKLKHLPRIQELVWSGGGE